MASPPVKAAEPESQRVAEARSEASTTTIKEGPSVLEELTRKLQPAQEAREARTQAEKDRLEALLPEAYDLAEQFSKRLGEGDLEGAERLCVSEEDLKEALTEGHYAILSGRLVPMNHDRIESLIAKLKGKDLKHSFEPGELSVSQARTPFKAGLPLLSDARIHAHTAAAEAEIRLEHVVYLGERWIIFQLTTR